ncbi:MAG: hypothetical protein GX187_06400 [Clostridiaceae bacterium]|nr:hypothetical protein [Clostridiaceae bacterium]
MDIFLEKIVKKQKNVLDFLIIIGIVLAAIILSYLLLILVPGFSTFLVVGVIYLAYWLITNRNIEFEYAVTNGDLDIDKIINQRKRKRIFSGNVKEFEVVARVNSDKYTNQIKQCKNVKDYSSNNKNAEVWFIYINKGEPTVILFEPTPKMVDSLFTFAPRVVYRY